MVIPHVSEMVRRKGLVLLYSQLFPWSIGEHLRTIAEPFEPLSSDGFGMLMSRADEIGSGYSSLQFSCLKGKVSFQFLMGSLKVL